MYDIEEVSADKAYSSRENLDAVDKAGGIPFIPFKSNVDESTRAKGAPMWKKMYEMSVKHPKEFDHHYHKRSNAETTFHMIKKKFGKHLRCKKRIGQENEILAKCLCHNLCVLIKAMFELNIDIDFEKCAEIPIAQQKME